MILRLSAFKTPAGIIGAALLALLGLIGWRGSTVLLRRRTPDPPDSPANYGLDYDTVSFTSRDGILLRGWWIRPPQPKGMTLVICHGHNGSMDGDTAQAARLAKAGFHVLLFNFRTHGTSGGEQVTFGAREHLDVLGALDWLAATQGIRRAGLVGFSMGAGVALIAAAHDERVAAVVADGTICRLRDAITGLARERGLPAWVARPPAAAILLAASLRARTWLPWADPIRWAAEVRCPVLFIHGEADPFVTMEGARMLAQAAGTAAKLWIVPGAGHRDAYLHSPTAYYERVIAFLERYLAAGPQSGAG